MTQLNILVLSLGGTITMTPGADGTISPNLTADDLLRAVPGIDAHAAIEAVSALKLPGASLTLDHLIDIGGRIEQRLANGVDGVVVVQGTDTIEETAFVLDVLVRSGKPVVVTGAMRGAAAPGAEGPANILSAVLTAASPEAHGLGTLVVLNDQIHAARLVQKSHTALPSAFTSPLAGPLGIVAEHKALFYARVQRTQALPAAPLGPDAPVALMTIGLGDDGRLLKALPGLGYRGAVIAGMGVGHAPSWLVPVLEDLARSMPVVLSTRVASGPSFRATYGFPGSEADLLARGLVSAKNLPALKARLLLALLLRTGVERGDIERVIGEYGV
jgi:L-asparaginase